MLESSPIISVSGSDQKTGTSRSSSNPSPGPTLPTSVSVVNAPPETLKNITKTRAAVFSARRNLISFELC